MRFLILFVGLLFFSSDAVAQSSTKPQNRRSITANEYIESTSPMPNGGSVTSRSQPGKNVQTVTTIANLPVLGSSQAAASQNNNSPQARTASASYPYPAANRPATSVAQIPSQRQTASRQAFQVPTLGLTPIVLRLPPSSFSNNSKTSPQQHLRRPRLAACPTSTSKFPAKTADSLNPGFNHRRKLLRRTMRCKAVSERPNLEPAASAGAQTPLAPS